MCGIGGFWLHDATQGTEEMEATLLRMSNAQSHRGPDSGGIFIDQVEGLGLCHRRLSIIELSEAGSQPMTSSDGRWTVVYNGEWYDHLNHRRELTSIEWRGNSDTETLLESLATTGMEGTLKSINGMFAFAAWDRKERELHIVRDRFGIKPVYIGQQNGMTVFSSELAGFFSHGGFDIEIDPQAALSFLRLNYVPHPLCICKDVRKLSPGFRAVVKKDGEIMYFKWYDLTTKLIHPHHDSDEDHIEEMERELFESVSRRMLSDVPLGSLLSGGIDSSLVTLLMQRHSTVPIKTFSVGFAESTFDESKFAREVSELIETDHHELMIQPSDVLAMVPEMAGIFSEPLGDASQIPTLMVSRMARERVTVALGGDGGDEVFAGYLRYRQSLGGNRFFDGPFSIMRRPSSRLARSLPISFWDLALGWLPKNARPRHPGDWIHRWGRRALVKGPIDFHAQLVEQWIDQIGSGSGKDWEREESLENADPGVQFSDLQRLQMIDIGSWMVDDILAKVDTSSMACGLEVRVPLLDHIVVEKALSLESSMRYSKKRGEKWILRQILGKHLPMGIFERPKQGFVLPIEKWIRGPLEGWIRSLLTEEKLLALGIPNTQDFIKILDLHIEGRGEYATPIWTLVSLLSWKEKWLPGSNVEVLY